LLGAEILITQQYETRTTFAESTSAQGGRRGEHISRALQDMYL